MIPASKVKKTSEEFHKQEAERIKNSDEFKKDVDRIASSIGEAATQGKYFVNVGVRQNSYYLRILMPYVRGYGYEIEVESHDNTKLQQSILRIYWD
jgi:hypothetical protein